MRKKLSRYFGGLIFAFLMLCMFAGTAMAAEEALYVNGVKYTASVGYKALPEGGFSWNAGDATLTLINAAITQTTACSCGHESAIHYEGTKTFHINLQGKNTIALDASGTQKKSGIVYSDNAGKAGNTITITGEEKASDGKSPSLTLTGITGDAIFGGYVITIGADLKINSEGYGIRCPKENGCFSAVSDATKGFPCAVEIHTTGNGEAVNVDGSLLLLNGTSEFYSEKTVPVKASFSIAKSGLVDLNSKSLLVADGPDNVLAHLEHYYVGDKLPDEYFGNALKNHYVWIYERGGNIAEDGFTITLSEETYRYDGTAKTPAVVIKDRYGAKLIQSEDYEVAYENNTEAGKASVIITGLKKDKSDTNHFYQGTVTKNFSITNPIGSTVDVDKVKVKIISDTEAQFISSEEKQTVTVPDTITYENKDYRVVSIAPKAFFKNTQLRTVRIGKYVKTIGNKAFSGCTKLSGISGGSNVETIGSKVFYGCTSLRKLVITKKVKGIGAYAFKGCKNLGRLQIKSKVLTAEKVSKNAFKGLKSTTIITVPSSVRKAYDPFLPKKK